MDIRMAAPQTGQQQHLSHLAPAGRPGRNRSVTQEPPSPHGDELEFRALAENLPAAVMRFDTRLRCTYANPALEHCLGITAERAVGCTLAELGLPRRLATLLGDNLRLALASGQAPVIEFSLATGRGERHCEARIVPERGPDGVVFGMLAIAHDVTERKRTEQALRRKTEALQRTNAELEEFAYIASHDLKGPLRNVHALSSWIEEEVAEHLSTEGRGRLALLRERLRRMDELIDATLRYARAAGTPNPIEEVETAQLVWEAVQTCPRASGFTITVDPRLPRLRTDRALLQQVLTNLITNAIEHHDRTDGRVCVTAQDRGDFVLFSVIDDGPGIPPSYHDRIFHMFQRGPQPTPGHGLGLAIARKVVGRVGGNLELESAPGWGSSFHFTWPKAL